MRRKEEKNILDQNNEVNLGLGEDLTREEERRVHMIDLQEEGLEAITEILTVEEGNTVGEDQDLLTTEEEDPPTVGIGEDQDPLTTDDREDVMTEARVMKGGHIQGLLVREKDQQKTDMKGTRDGRRNI